MFGKFTSQMMYAQVVAINTEKPRWTSTCRDCGKCEKACPQHIEIRSEFRKVRRDLEGPGMLLLSGITRPLVNRIHSKS
ncbi:MAG: 4Fe-4S dicluster domain-containing protein [Spirochaetaceae bacterium]|nr:MAG: 4Fe-4S dicluster domain-containing protein [Spirochaetaceae bacterium]